MISRWPKRGGGWSGWSLARDGVVRPRFFFTFLLGDGNESTSRNAGTNLCDRPLQVTKSIVSLLRYYKWNKFSMVVENSPRWQTVAKSLEELATKTYNMTINHRLPFEDTNRCCANKESCCHISWMYNIVAETNAATRSTRSSFPSIVCLVRQGNCRLWPWLGSWLVTGQWMSNHRTAWDGPWKCLFRNFNPFYPKLKYKRILCILLQP